MNEIGNIIELFIKTIGRSQNDNLEKKTLIWNIYNNISAKGECAHPIGEVLKILIDTSYTVTMDIEEHPEYKKYKDFFDELRRKGVENFIEIDPLLGRPKRIKMYPRQIRQNPPKEVSHSNPVTCEYRFEEDKLYVDFNSTIFPKKDDKSTLINYGPFKTLYLIMHEAERLGDLKTIYACYTLMVHFYVSREMYVDKDLADAKCSFDILKEKYFVEIKKIFIKNMDLKNIHKHNPDPYMFVFTSADEIIDFCYKEFTSEEEMKEYNWLAIETNTAVSSAEEDNKKQSETQKIYVPALAKFSIVTKPYFFIERSNKLSLGFYEKEVKQSFENRDINRTTEIKVKGKFPDINKFKNLYFSDKYHSYESYYFKSGDSVYYLDIRHLIFVADFNKLKNKYQKLINQLNKRVLDRENNGYFRFRHLLHLPNDKRLERDIDLENLEIQCTLHQLVDADYKTFAPQHFSSAVDKNGSFAMYKWKK